MGFTFFTTMIAWVFFRSDTVENAFIYLFNLFIWLKIPSTNRYGLIYVIIIVICDWIMRHDEINVLKTNSTVINWLIVLIVSV